MEVIVDDTQLSLAIGKKGQNVRLAAKLLGWRIDIKSEEEKRQEVESQMAALVVPGAPVSVLIDHGLTEAVVEKLMASGRHDGGEAGRDDAGAVGRNSGHRCRTWWRIFRRPWSATTGSSKQQEEAAVRETGCADEVRSDPQARSSAGKSNLLR